MAKIALTPTVLKNATMKVAADNYEAAISEAAFVPAVASSSVSFKGIDGSTYSETTTQASTWTLNLTYAQDFTLATSLSNYLHAHEGEEVEAVFVPEEGSGLPEFTSTITIVPGQIGGPVDTVLTSTVSLPATKPVPGTTA